jgi:hypothetical protein
MEAAGPEAAGPEAARCVLDMWVDSDWDGLAAIEREAAVDSLAR